MNPAESWAPCQSAASLRAATRRRLRERGASARYSLCRPRYPRPSAQRSWKRPEAPQGRNALEPAGDLEALIEERSEALPELAQRTERLDVDLRSANNAVAAVNIASAELELFGLREGVSSLSSARLNRS